MPPEAMTTDELLDRLGETEAQPRKKLTQMALRLGPVAMAALVDAVFAIEAHGGLLTSAGQRRTPGGVLFMLTRAGLFLPRDHLDPAPPAMPPETLLAALATVPSDLSKGAATVKLVLVGRPKETVERGDYVITQMTSRAPQGFPKGLPTPAATETVWTVLIARKQWGAVASALKRDQADKLVVEGQPCQQDGALVLYATQVITQGQQRAKKEAQRAAAPVIT